MMKVDVFTDVGGFLLAAEGFLERAEAVNGLALGVCSMLQRGPGRRGRRRRGGAPFLAVVRDELGEVVLTAVSTNRRLVLSSYLDAPQTAVSALVPTLLQQGETPHNVRAAAPVADAFAQMWTAATGQAAQPGMRQRVYELRAVTWAGGVNGRLRLGTADDFYLLRDWAEGFMQEALDEQDREAAHLMIAQYVQNQDLYVWEDGEPVAMASKLRPTRHGIGLGLVYTPLAKRGHGYGHACVAALSQRLLDEGRQFCTLLADLANPASHHIYEAVGYRPLATFHEYKLV